MGAIVPRKVTEYFSKEQPPALFFSVFFQKKRYF